MATYYICSGTVTYESINPTTHAVYAECTTTFTSSTIAPTSTPTTSPLTPQDALLLSGAVLSVWAVSWLYRVIRPTL